MRAAAKRFLEWCETFEVDTSHVIQAHRLAGVVHLGRSCSSESATREWGSLADVMAAPDLCAACVRGKFSFDDAWAGQVANCYQRACLASKPLKVLDVVAVINRKRALRSAEYGLAYYVRKPGDIADLACRTQEVLRSAHDDLHLPPDSDTSRVDKAVRNRIGRSSEDTTPVLVGSKFRPGGGALWTQVMGAYAIRDEPSGCVLRVPAWMSGWVAYYITRHQHKHCPQIMVLGDDDDAHMIARLWDPTSDGPMGALGHCQASAQLLIA